MNSNETVNSQYLLVFCAADVALCLGNWCKASTLSFTQEDPRAAICFIIFRSGRGTHEWSDVLCFDSELLHAKQFRIP